MSGRGERIGLMHSTEITSIFGSSLNQWWSSPRPGATHRSLAPAEGRATPALFFFFFDAEDWSAGRVRVVVGGRHMQPATARGGRRISGNGTRVKPRLLLRAAKVSCGGGLQLILCCWNK
jgi:hypothetical protein